MVLNLFNSTKKPTRATICFSNCNTTITISSNSDQSLKLKNKYSFKLKYVEQEYIIPSREFSLQYC